MEENGGQRGAGRVLSGRREGVWGVGALGALGVLAGRGGPGVDRGARYARGAERKAVSARRGAPAAARHDSTPGELQ